MTFEGKWCRKLLYLSSTRRKTRYLFNYSRHGTYRHYKEVKKTISERDYVLMWNLMPQDYDEAVHLIPNLDKTPREVVQKIINFLNEKRGMSRQN